MEQLRAVGVERLYQEKASGVKTDRPELAALLDYVREGVYVGRKPTARAQGSRVSCWRREKPRRRSRLRLVSACRRCTELLQNAGLLLAKIGKSSNQLEVVMKGQGSASDRRKYRRSRNCGHEEIMKTFTFVMHPLGQEFTVMAASWKDAFDQVWATLDETQREAVRSLEVMTSAPLQ